MANIWINNPFDNLEEEGSRPQRYAMLSSELVKQGHKVVWWTSDFSHVHKAKRVDPSGKPLPRSFRNPAGVEIRLVPTLPYAKNVSLRRLRSHGLYAATWYELAAAAVKSSELPPPDAIIVSLPPLDVFEYALKFKKAYGSRLVTDIQDAWPEAFEGLLPRPVPLRHLLWKTLFAKGRRQAKNAYCKANLITGVGDAYLQLARSYGAACPMLKFRLGIGECRSSPPHPPGKTVKLVYGGNMGKSYDLPTLVSAVRELADSGMPITLDLAGTGTEEKSLRNAAAGCDAIRFLGFLNKKEYEALLADAGIGVIPMFERSLVAVPNKVADYAAAGLAVINSLPGETADIIGRYNAGCKYEAGNAESLKAAIRSLAADKAALTQKRGNALKMAYEEFLAADIYPKFCKAIIDTLTDQESAPHYRP